MSQSLPPAAPPGEGPVAPAALEEHSVEQEEPAEEYSVTPWPTSPVAAQIPVSPTVASNGMPALDPPKHVWANMTDGTSRPVAVPPTEPYDVPKPLGIRDPFEIRRVMDETFRFRAEDAEDDSDDRQAAASEPSASGSDPSATPINTDATAKPSLTPSMEAMVLNDKAGMLVDADADSDTMDVDREHGPDSEEDPQQAAKPTFSLSPSVSWKPGDPRPTPPTPTNEPFTPSYLEKRPAFRVIRGPGSGGSSSTPPPTIKSHPRASTTKYTPEPSLSRTGPSRQAAARARIATQKAQESEEDDWDDGEDEREDDDEPEEEDEDDVEPPANKDGAFDIDDAPALILAPPRKRGRPPNSSLVDGKRRKTGDRYPCTVPGCAKTFTRRNDVERHIKSSGAHPEVKTADDSKRCKHCGTDLSRADARLRHERTNACGKRNLQHTRTKSSPGDSSPVKPRVVQEA